MVGKGRKKERGREENESLSQISITVLSCLANLG